MANNRLYLVDTEEKQFIMIAKGWGAGWQLGNIDQLEEFLRTLYQDGDYKPTCLVIGTENDREFYNKHLKDAANFNIKAGWKYYEPTDAALIAAAPEMLEQLKAAIEFLDKYWGTTAMYQLIEDYEEYHSIRSVIAKAEGNVLHQEPTE